MKMRDKKQIKRCKPAYSGACIACLKPRAYRSIHILRAGYTFSSTAAEIAVIKKFVSDRDP